MSTQMTLDLIFVVSWLVVSGPLCHFMVRVRFTSCFDLCIHFRLTQLSLYHRVSQRSWHAYITHRVSTNVVPSRVVYNVYRDIYIAELDRLAATM